MNDYYDKYMKYKTKYILLKSMNHYGGYTKKDKFYFIHATNGFKSLLNILKDGYIKLGSVLAKQQKKGLTGNDAHNKIYANVYFEDIKNIQQMFNYSLIIHPDIVKVAQIEFHGGWGYISGPHIKINNYDEFKKQVPKIKEFIKTPTLPKHLVGSGVMEHEIIFNDPISVKKYVIGIHCMCDKDKINKLKYVINKNNYDIKIFETNIPVLFHDLIK